MAKYQRRGVNLPTLNGSYVQLTNEGSSVGIPSLSGGVPGFDVSSVWGVDSSGIAYYDPAGVPDTDVAVMQIDSSTGAPYLVKIGH